jgi:hypothetical protein
MIASARIDEELRPAGFDWITALRAPDIQALAEEGGPLKKDLFDEVDMAEITSPLYPDERLVVCRNEALAVERARRREALLCESEKKFRFPDPAGIPNGTLDQDVEHFGAGFRVPKLQTCQVVQKRGDGLVVSR